MGREGHSSRLAKGLEGTINALRLRHGKTRPTRSGLSRKASITTSLNGTSRQSSVFEMR